MPLNRRRYWYGVIALIALALTAAVGINLFIFIEFTPSEIQGLPEQVTLGEPFTVQVSGDLTIRDLTKPVVFEITVTPVSETRLEATATTTIQRADYELTIPDVPFVADVGEAVQLEIDFVAIPG